LIIHGLKPLKFYKRFLDRTQTKTGFSFSDAQTFLDIHRNETWGIAEKLEWENRNMVFVGEI